MVIIASRERAGHVGVCYKCKTIFRYQWIKADECPACLYPTGLYFYSNEHYLKFVQKHKPQENGFKFLHDTWTLVQLASKVGEKTRAYDGIG